MTDDRRRRGSRARPPLWLWAAGLSFAAYFALLLVCDARRPDATGFDLGFDADGAFVAAVAPGLAADSAGLAPGDRIVSYAGRPAATRIDWLAAEMNLARGQVLEIAFTRAGAPGRASLALDGWYVRFPPRLDTVALVIALAGQAFTLGLAALVAYRRPRDPLARLGAWLLASVGVFTIVLPLGFAVAWRQVPAPLSWLLWIPFVSGAAAGVLFFLFACRFPRPAFRSPWTARLLALPAAAPLAWHVHFGVAAIVGGAAVPVGPDGSIPLAAANVAYLAAGLGLLGRQYALADQPGERRRLRVLLAGCTVAGLACLVVALRYWLRPTPELTQSLFGSPVTLAGVPLMLALPLSIAYTILRERLFDVGLIVRQGVRYALARRLLLSIAPLIVLALLVDIVRHGHEPLFDLLERRGWIYAVTGAALVSVVVHRDRWLTALDRRFFRARYHAERILRDVAAQLRDTREPVDAVETAVRHVERALAPHGIAALAWQPGDASYRAVASGSEPVEGLALEPGSRLVELARLLARPIDLSPDADAWIDEHLPADEARRVYASRLELLVPVVVDDARHVLLALGPRRSEEPYSADDLALLEAVAGSLALLLEREGTALPSGADAWLTECPACGACHDTSVARCPDDRALLLATDLPPVLNGRYRLERRIGAGGMGTVYAADDMALGRPVAVKVLAAHLAGSRDATRRFRREAQTAAAFAHPHVVTIHDFGVTAAHRAYLVMERLEGDTLRAALADGPLSAARAMEVAGDLCAVLAAAHARGLVHRDLKPENVMLADTGGTPRTTVLDFGIAKALAPDGEARDTATAQGVLVGSVPYMAPEQLAGGPVHPSWDLWALAVTTYEMFAGCRPRTPAAAAHPLAPPLAAFFDAALDEHAARRPQGAAEFKSALEHALRLCESGDRKAEG